MNRKILIGSIAASLLFGQIAELQGSEFEPKLADLERGVLSCAAR